MCACVHTCMPEVCRCPWRPQSFPGNHGKPPKFPRTENRIRIWVLQKYRAVWSTLTRICCAVASLPDIYCGSDFFPLQLAPHPNFCSLYYCGNFKSSCRCAGPRPWAAELSWAQPMTVPLWLRFCTVLWFLKLLLRELLQAQLNFISTALEMKHSFQKLPTIHF